MQSTTQETTDARPESSDAPSHSPRPVFVAGRVYTRAETRQGLGISQTTLWRLGVRELLKPIPGLRDSYAGSAILRFIGGQKGAK
jgi:hypothetical protein